MSDVIISRRQGGGSGSGKLITEYIMGNYVFFVPENAVNNQFDVRLFGAGGGNWGGSGYMNNDILTLTPGEKIKIIVGSPTNYTGGTTSFGTYLSANGGSDGDGGSGGYRGYGHGGNGIQFGGSASSQPQSKFGKKGGVWGGGGGFTSGGWGVGGARGGDGGMYGGGGGGYSGWGRNNGYVSCSGGNGGMYGGGGGGGSLSVNSSSWLKEDYNNTYGTNENKVRGGFGGQYGGNGGYGSINMIFNNIATDGENGTNTIGWINIMEEACGTGEGGKLFRSGNNSGGGGGGGGFGGKGGNANSYSGGGGGGYGSNGGTGVWIFQGWCSGGGGGYLGDGGTLGGGGGYGKVSIGRIGGGGYYCPGGGINNSNGGGGIGLWTNDGEFIASYGSGGSNPNVNSSTPAESGICIIQYYLK